MSKFKQFLIKEEFGLGDIKQKINKIFDNKSYSNFLSSSTCSPNNLLYVIDV